MNHAKRCNSLSIAVAIATGIGLSTTPAVTAQEAAAEKEEQVLEEIIVTARKREESLQDLALSVSAMGQQEIEQSFAVDLRQLIYISPNTVLDDTAP